MKYWRQTDIAGVLGGISMEIERQFVYTETFHGVGIPKIFTGCTNVYVVCYYSSGVPAAVSLLAPKGEVAATTRFRDIVHKSLDHLPWTTYIAPTPGIFAQSTAKNVKC